MRAKLGNDLSFGRLPGGNAELLFSRTERDKHLYICGGTGTGKSKFLEHLIRQDILSWRKSKCGMLVLDPHGSLYDSLIKWMAWHNLERPVIPIDLRRDDWIVSYNLLRQRKSADPAVLVDNLTDAMAYVWGQGGTNETPLFARWVGNIIRALYEKKLTLVEAELLVDRMAKQTRHTLTSDLADKSARQDWQFIATLSPRDFEAQLGSTINRLQRFLRNQTLRSMFGQVEMSLDLGTAIEEGSIILVNLATERAKVSKENAELFATLLLSDLWTAAQERGKSDCVKPFYIYLDEFQRFITPTISENLDEARGFGLHLTMAHQFPNQLLDRGENGKRVYNSIMENASSKVVFRLTHEENLRSMAQWLFMGIMNPDEVKHEMYSTKVMEYREELKTIHSEGVSSSTSHGQQTGQASGMGHGGTQVFPFDGTEAPSITSDSVSEFASTSSSESESYSEGKSRSKTIMPTLVPVLGKELSHVQFRSMDEQLFRAMAVLFDQQQRQGVARLVGMKAPVSIYTPEIPRIPFSEERTTRYVEQCYKKFPFVLTSAKAQQHLAERTKKFADELGNKAENEPVAIKRRVR
jgi:hypothetical protein